MEETVKTIPSVVILSALAAASLPAAAQDAKVGKQSFVYKTVESVAIRLDVYRLDDAKPRPVLVWIHGGALITGSRNGVPRDLLELTRTDGVALVSIDYRLAPEVKIAAIIEDVKDAFAWIRQKGPEAAKLDPARIIVAGGSAGGYLTLMTGICVEPKPTALVSYWGYGDVDGDWYTKPSEFYRTAQRLVDKAEAYRAVGAGVLTAPTDAENAKARGRFYLYCRQNGLWTKEVTGFDPATQRAKLDPFCPVRNVTPQYPPVILIHGTVDTDVPHELSIDMDRALTKHGVRHELVLVQGAGHGLAGGDRKLNEEARAKAVAFIRERIK
jgi:acetyl esterase/lipase